MKQMVILSGKGGTGKTSVAAAFAHLAHAGPFPLRAVLADADVDAANLELLLEPQVQEDHPFVGAELAVVDPELCTGCGLCAEICRFDAVAPLGHAYTVDPIGCEGCAACHYGCLAEAIRMEPQVAGRWFRSETRYGPLFHAALRPAQESSGKLIALVRQQAYAWAHKGGYQALLVDGPPGIGCPAISAVSGVDLVVVVTEPTLAGVHDMERTLDLAGFFHVPALVCINKADLYWEGTAQIAAHCHERGVEIVGQIPFDRLVTDAMSQALPVTVRYPDGPASQAIIAAWERVAARLNGIG